MCIAKTQYSLTDDPKRLDAHGLDAEHHRRGSPRKRGFLWWPSASNMMLMPNSAVSRAGKRVMRSSSAKSSGVWKLRFKWKSGPRCLTRKSVEEIWRRCHQPAKHSDHVLTHCAQPELHSATKVPPRRKSGVRYFLTTHNRMVMVDLLERRDRHRIQKRWPTTGARFSTPADRRRAADRAWVTAQASWVSKHLSALKRAPVWCASPRVAGRIIAVALKALAPLMDWMTQYGAFWRDPIWPR